MTSERTLSLLCTVQTERDSHIDRSGSLRAAHRTRGIYDSQTVEGRTVEVISKVIPVLIYHQTVSVVQLRKVSHRPVGTGSENLHSFSDTLVRIQRLSVDLLSSILSEVGIGLNVLVLSTLEVVSCERVLVNHTGARRNLVELNLVPTTLRHQTLQNVDSVTQNAQSLTVLLVSHAEVLTSYICQTARFTRRGILGLQPLSKQGRCLALNVEVQLLLDECESVCLSRSAFKYIQVVPATELRNVTHIANHSRSILLSEVTHYHTEEASLTLTTTNVADIEQALQSVHRVLSVCLTEHKNYILVRTLTHCCAHSEHIEQVALSSYMGHSAIFSQSEVGVINEAIHELIHIAYLLFHFVFSWTRE